VNAKHQELLDRLTKAVDNISKSSKTMAALMPFIENLAVALEEIAEDLATTPDEQVAKDVRETIALPTDRIHCCLTRDCKLAAF